MNRKRISLALVIGALALTGLFSTGSGWAQDKPLPPDGGSPPETDPNSGATPPFYYPQFFVTPERPTEQDTVTITVEGSFPDTSYKVTGQSVEIRDNMIFMNLATENEGAGAEVLIPSKHTFTVGPLKAGGYAAFLMVSNPKTGTLEAGYTKFTVGGDGGENPGGGDGDPDVEPNPVPYGAKVWTDPARPEGDKPFRINLSGMFPSPGYEFTRKDLKVEEYVVWVTVDVKEPEGPQPAVVVPFEEVIGQVSLPAREYKLVVVLNGFQMDSYYLPVGDVIVDDGRDKIMLNYRREGGFAGSTAWVNLWPDHRYEKFNSLQGDDTVESGLVDETIWAELMELLPAFETFQEAYKPTQNVADGFAYTITYKGRTVEAMDGAEMPEKLSRIIQLLGFIADDVTPVRVKYERAGGIAGGRSWLEILDTGKFLRYNSLRLDAGQEAGTVPQTDLDALYDALARAQFSTLPNEIGPLYRSDVQVYTITLDNHTVTVSDGGEIPEALQESIGILETILNTAKATPPEEKDSGTVTAVEAWSMF